MEQSEDFIEKRRENHVCLLKKAIYKLKHTSRTWNIKIYNTLVKLSFKQIHLNASVYVHQQHRRGQLMLILYVDDIFPMRNDRSAIAALKKDLMDCYKM